ncbi:MAG: zinc-ribbon domain-containing protein [Bacillus sp. (in: Bacteria)]|nr:zinc-ribbon domain-containing protein [Bacillus sp. (in: firmicutes)]MCM1426439.1 zinc-ribbon domain-containing protein [Eubacterium sp.]
MFCKKCGQKIKDGVKYCPKCGNETGSVLPQMQAGGQPLSFQQSVSFRQSSPVQQEKRTDKGKAIDRRILFVGIGIAVIVLAAVIIGLIMKAGQEDSEEDATIIGEWISDDFVNMGTYMEDVFEEVGVPDWAIDFVMEQTGLNTMGTLTLTFTGSGKILLGVDGVSMSFGSMTYEELREGRIVLKYDVNATVLGFGVPVSVAYTSDYTIDKDSMEMDFFGCKIKFSRVD